MDWVEFLSGSQDTVKALVGFVCSGIAVLIGVMFIASGVNKMIAHGRGERHGQPTVGPVVGNFFFGALLLQLSWTIGVLSVSLFTVPLENPNNAMAYMPDPVTQNQTLHNAVNAAVLWIYFIGFIAVIRGFVQWNALANGERGQGNDWRGLWHILFGAAAINITALVRMFTT